MPAITVVGNTVADLSFDLPSEFLHGQPNRSVMTLPFGSKLPAKGYQLAPGGSGANVAVGLRQGGLTTYFLTGLSGDPLGQFLAAELKKVGLELTTAQPDGASNLSVILRIKAERTIITAHSASYDYLGSELPRSGWLHVGPLPASQDNFYQRLLAHAAQTSQSFSLNPDSEVLRERSRHFLIAVRSATVLFVNQEEAALLARLPSRSAPTDLVRALGRLGPKVVAVTCGAKGAYVGTPIGTFFAPATANSSDRVDATGAGDAFASGFLIGYLDPSLTDEKALVSQALTFGALNAGSVVTQVGAQAGLLTRDQLEREARTVTLKKMEES